MDIDVYCKYKNGQIIQPYSCILNQTDLNKNKNKFYLMQIINHSLKYIHYIRFGRIGEAGRIILHEYDSLSDAVFAFEKQFYAKTYNRWKNKENFVIKHKKYYLTEINDSKNDKSNNIKVHEPESKLNVNVQSLLKILSSVDMLNNSLMELNIDTFKLPLGKLKIDQLNKAKDILNEITKLIDMHGDENNYDDIIKLSSLYYTLIPSNIGRKKPALIDCRLIIDHYYAKINDLISITINNQIINQRIKDINPLDSIYNELKTEIKHLPKDSAMWGVISKYIINTHAPTHSFKLNLVDIYSINRESELNFNPKIGNRQLLVHGSRMCNWLSMIKLGLILDPSRIGALITGKMFGYGVYFSNCFSKSAQYCGVKIGESGTICLLLASVALGEELTLMEADPSMTGDKVSKFGYNSVWGQGMYTPSSMEEIVHNDKLLLVPNGSLIKSNIDTVLNYDEKIIYDVNQLKMEYLVVLDMDYRLKN